MNFLESLVIVIGMALFADVLNEYIKKKYKYAKTIFISTYYIEYLSEYEQIIINDLEELKPILRKLKFNAVYIIGFNYKEIYEYLIKSEKISTLF